MILFLDKNTRGTRQVANNSSASRIGASANASFSLYTPSATGNTTETRKVEMQPSAPYMGRPDRDLALINQSRPYRIYGWALSR